jgi:hypothetical protein
MKYVSVVIVLLLMAGYAQGHDVGALPPTGTHSIASSEVSYAFPKMKLVRVYLQSHDDVYTLNEFDITIMHAGENFAAILVNDDDIGRLRTNGYRVEILIDDYQKYNDELFERGFYHTYAETYSVLDSFVNGYPDLCRLDTIGYSIQNRAIWALRLTDNPDIEENEPEIRLKGNIHGDEHIGTEITLFFIRYLLTNYATVPQVQHLVDNMEFWILPVLNPDGKVANTRRNMNFVDLNRDYGFFWSGWGGSPGPNSQVETQAVVQHLEENNISFEFDFHSSPEWINVICYPWSYHQADPPDSQHIVAIGQDYTSAIGYSCWNGYDWYQICGESGDYTLGTSGAFTFATENPRDMDTIYIDTVCIEHRDALMTVCERAGWGIEGVVKDSLTNDPLYARIEFDNPDRIDMYTDPNLGDFHKMIEPGTYDLSISANGYMPRTVTGVTVPAIGSASVGDVLLTADSSFLHAFRAVLCRYANHSAHNNATRPRYALGPPDDMFFSLGYLGYIVLDMGPASSIENIAGDDFTVYEGDDGTDEGYRVYASNTWDGPWQLCGVDTGTASFDLADAGLDRARYIRIEDYSAYTVSPFGGFDLDAIHFASAVGIEEAQSVDAHPYNLNMFASPNPFRNITSIRYTIHDSGHTMQNPTLQVYDAIGRVVKQWDYQTIRLSHYINWDGTDDDNKKVSSGVYFLQLTAGDYSATEKLLLIR